MIWRFGGLEVWRLGGVESDDVEVVGTVCCLDTLLYLGTLPTFV